MILFIENHVVLRFHALPLELQELIREDLSAALSERVKVMEKCASSATDATPSLKPKP